MTTFPRLGAPGVFTSPYYPNHGERLRSQFVPDEVVNPHIRFPTLAANIRARRGRKVEINVPIFRDVNTPWPFKDPNINYDLHDYPEDDDVRNGAAKENHIYMDAMVFGMGSCCLQITFQAKNINEGRRLYDQLSPLGPIMLALTAATPLYRGYIADTDVRWNQISSSVDDRTPEELGEKPLQNDRWTIPKSRYAANSTYISQDPQLRPEYLDPDLVVDEELKAKLKEGGMDDLLATHFAHLFIRDPLVVFSEDLQSLDLDKTDHFENLQSTNWQHMRFKPPPHDKDTGWRVEFRPMEIQITDFENAAFSVFLVLITRAILSFDLNFYIPIAKTTENMQTAHMRDAVLDRKFYFRKRPLPERRPHKHSASNSSVNLSGMNNGVGVGGGGGGGGGNTNGVSHTHTQQQHHQHHHHLGPSRPPSPMGPVEEEYCLMTIDEIINGVQQSSSSSSKTFNDHSSEFPSVDPTDPPNDHDIPPSTSKDNKEGNEFPGLIPLVESYLDSMNIDVSTRCELNRYLSLIRKRASGELWTPARWIRQYVRSHKGYRGDSVVSEDVTWDLVRAVERIGCGEGVVVGWLDGLGGSGGLDEGRGDGLGGDGDGKRRREGWEMLGDLFDCGDLLEEE
ncbi:MAG: Zn finger-containing GTPase- Activating Protein for ARF [Watsoniomyces obsoletus]|nr:MAG: Zn finger-containing GTPase- Activating Protein for ARF [Watsoniomyces obsoletus]